MKKYSFQILAGSVWVWAILFSNAFAQTDGTRIKFLRGAASATVKGTVAKGGPDFYLVNAKAGQTMTVKVTGKVSFGIDSPAGRLTEDDGNTNWSEELSADGDYKIKVFSSGGAQNYTLTVSISAAQKTFQKFTTSGFYNGIGIGSQSGDPGGMSVFLTESDGQLYALAMTAAGDFFTPVLLEAKASGKDMRTIEFTLPADNNYNAGAKYRGTVSAAGLTFVSDGSKEVLKRNCGFLVSDLTVGSGGDYGGMEVFLTDAGGTWYALVTIAEGVLKRPVLVEVKAGLNRDNSLNTVEFTLPGENGGRKFTGKVTKTGMTLNEGGTAIVLKDKCYK